MAISRVLRILSRRNCLQRDFVTVLTDTLCRRSFLQTTDLKKNWVTVERNGLFAQKFYQKLALFAQTACYCNKMITTLVFEKNAFFRRKSPKIVIITSTPGPESSLRSGTCTSNSTNQLGQITRLVLDWFG
jgi:hypothetical protein